MESRAGHLNSMYNRADDTTRTYWTSTPSGSRFTGPVYILTSRSTFSGGEELAYDLKAQGRAILVGETTGGGANAGANVLLGQGYVAFIPTMRSINPITGTNWEHTGVEPEIAVPARDAMRASYIHALSARIPLATQDDERAYFEDLLAKAKRGEGELPPQDPLPE